jgi:MFS family permease
LRRAQLSEAERRQNLIAVTAAMSVTSLIYGLSLPLLSLVMDQRGVDDTLIGLSTATQSIAILLVAPFLPPYMSRVGPAALMLAAILLSLVAFLLLPVFSSMPAWFLLRFAIGAAGSVLWVCGEAWINELAHDSTRGRTVALYSMAVAGGFALGPLVLSVTGSEGFKPFLLSGAIMLLSALPLLAVVRVAPRLHGERSGVLYHYLRLAPVAMLLCALFALVDGLLLTFLPLYGLRLELSEARSLYLITMMGVGGVAGQLPIGWLSDHVDRMLLAALSLLLLALAAGAMPMVIPNPLWSWPFMLMFGAVLSGIYTIALIIIGERFKGADLAAASALFGVMWGAGSMLGPALGGIAMAHYPPHGVPMMLTLLFALFLPLPLLGWLRRRREPTPGRDHSRPATRL